MGSDLRQEVRSRAADACLPFRWAVAIVAFRLLNAILVRTSFAPDEYWQSVEIAHRLVFGRGYVTWEWVEHIRGTFHPLIFTALFAAIKELRLDSPQTLVYMPSFCNVWQLHG